MTADRRALERLRAGEAVEPAPAAETSVALRLKPESWHNLFRRIRETKSLASGGKFWAAIQYLESQLAAIEGHEPEKHQPASASWPDTCPKCLREYHRCICFDGYTEGGES